MIHSAWRSQCEQYTVRLTQSALDQMLQLCRDHFPNEVGTSLVGSYSDDGSTASITGLAPFTTDSKQTPVSFVRGVLGLDGFFRRVFRRFGGQRHYVGEWHSHPNGSSTPSPTDDANQLQLCRDSANDCSEAILVIVGFKPDENGLSVWVYSATNGKQQLTLVETDSTRTKATQS